MMMQLQLNHKPVKLFGIDSVVLISDRQEPSEPASSLMERFKVRELDRVVKFLYLSSDYPSVRALRKEILRLIRDREIDTSRVVLLSDNPQAIKVLKSLGWAMSIGFTPTGTKKRNLYDYGADLVVGSPRDLSFVEAYHRQISFTQNLPSAFQYLHRDPFPFYHKHPVFFFDYDGTLTPIVRDPDKAEISGETRDLLKQLSNYYHVAIVSGRDINDIMDFVKLDELIYAGSHGFRISGPGGIQWEHGEAKKLIPLLDRAESEVRKATRGSKGVEIERKYFAIAIHYRNAPKNSWKVLNQLVNQVVKGSPDLKKSRGKKIIEVKPALDWNKGEAVKWIMRKYGLSYPGDYLPVFLGDDLTDEDAFRTLSDDGVGILVGGHQKPTAADLYLSGVDEVKKMMHVTSRPAMAN